MIRAGLAETSETSDFTSAQRRMEAARATRGFPPRDHWLAPFPAARFERQKRDAGQRAESRLHPPPGTASERDVLAIAQQESRLCELVDGVLGGGIKTV